MEDHGRDLGIGGPLMRDLVARGQDYKRTWPRAKQTHAAAGLETTWIPRKRYWYLAGPMTGYPQFNFPEFERVSGLLRQADYRVVTPHELDDNIIYHEVTASADGNEPHLDSQSEMGLGFLRRDANIVMHPNCVGTIALPGWQASYGAAQVEIYLANRFKKQTMAFIEDPAYERNFVLVQFDYNNAMAAYKADAPVGHPLALESLGPMR